MPEDAKRPTPRDVLRIVFRRRRLFVFALVLFVLATLIGARYFPVKYTGTARFQRRTDVAARGGPMQFSELKETLGQDIKGRTAIEKAIEDLDLTQGIPRGPDGAFTREGARMHQSLVQSLMQAVSVQLEVSTETVDIVRVSYTSGDRDLARTLPNIIVRNYIEFVHEKISRQLTDSRDFLLKEHNKADKRVSDLRAEKLDYEEKYGGMLPENPGTLKEWLREVNSDIDLTKRQLMVSRQKLESYQAMLDPDVPLVIDTAADSDAPQTDDTSDGSDATVVADGPQASDGVADAEVQRPGTRATPDSEKELIEEVEGPNPELTRLEAELRQAKVGLDQAIGVRGMKEAHPHVKVLQARIAELEERIAKTPATVVTERRYRPSDARRKERERELAIHIKVAEAEVMGFEHELKRLEARRANLELGIRDARQIRQKYEAIVEDLSAAQTERDTWQRKLTEVEMALGAEAAKRRTHLQAVELAEEQFRPSSPTLMKVLGFAFVGGLAFAAGLVFLSHMTDRSITTTEEIAIRYDIPVCGVIGEITTPADVLRRRVKWLAIWPAVALVFGVALAAAGLNIYLWLNAPERYSDWAANPVGYVWDIVKDRLVDVTSGV